MSHILEICAFISCISYKTIVIDIAIYSRKWRGSRLWAKNEFNENLISIPKLNKEINH